MEPITDYHSLRKQNIFVVEMESKIVQSLNSNWKVCCDWLADNNNFMSQASSSPTFR